MKTEQLQKELIDCGKAPIFEIPVIDKRTGEPDYIMLSISFSDGKCIGEREAINRAEEESELIATTTIEVEDDEGLDYHLQEMWVAATAEIQESEYFEMKH